MPQIAVFHKELNFLSEWCDSGTDTKKPGWDILLRIFHSGF